MDMTKMTKREKIAHIISTYPDVYADPIVKDYLDHEVELLDNRKNAPKTPTKKQTERASLADAVYSEMPINQKMTIGEMIKTLPSCSGLSTSAVRSLIEPSIKSGLVERTEEKRKPYFTRII